jgi:tetratricopeptide (TPR) repeat protein
MQSILDNPTQIEAVSQPKQSNFGAVAQQVNWLAIIENLYSMLLLLLPVFFLPITADPLNLNKTYLTVFIALLTLVLFFASGVQKGKISFYNVQSYLGLSILALSAIVSVIFSINRDNSIFGHFGNYSDSLVFILSILILGFVASNIRLNAQKLLKFFVLGTTISTIISLLVLYGVALPGIGVLPRVFSLAGSVYILMGLQIITVLVAVFQLLNTQVMKGKIIYSVALILNALYLIVILNPMAMIVLGAGLLVLFLYVHKSVPPASRTLFVGILIALAVLGFVHHYPMTRNAMGLDQMNTQPRLSVRESWIITAETLRDRPISGSGIGTFVNMFSLYRPASLNMGENWEARFESPYSDLLLWMGGAGLVGLLAYLIFIVFSLVTVKSLGREDDSSRLLTIVIPVALLALLLLGNNPVIYVLLFLALGVAVHKTSKRTFTVGSIPVLSVFVLIGLVMLAFSMYNAYKTYAGQYYFRDSLTKDNLGERFQLQAAAINADPKESVYQRSYISTGVAIASVLAQKQDLNDQEKQEIVNILSQSFNNVRFVTENFEPINVANWSLRGDLYASVMDLAEGADQLAVVAYRNALQLEGTNPNLWINLGSVYYRRQVYGEAVSAFLQAVQLKPDYANARYNLAYALKDAGYYADAATQMEVALRLVADGTPDHEKAMKDLEDFKKLADDAAKKAAAQQSPEGISGVNNQPKATSPSKEPLVAPEDRPNPQVESDDTTVQSGVEEKVDAELKSADGTEVPAGGKEAPIANPEN